MSHMFNADLTPLTVAILIFDDVEVLDFCGPFEVFSVANRESEPDAFNLCLVAESTTVTARGGLTVSRHFSIENCPAPDILLIPGGVGVNPLLESTSLLQWIHTRATECRILTSVCSGALLLGRCGLLDGLEVTTHALRMEELRAIAPKARVVEGRRFVDTGRVITSAGISAGIDMSLHIVSRVLGLDMAKRVAQRMEYEPGSPLVETRS